VVHFFTTLIKELPNFNPTFDDSINVSIKERNELLAITVSSLKTLSEKQNCKS